MDWYSDLSCGLGWILECHLRSVGTSCCGYLYYGSG